MEKRANRRKMGKRAQFRNRGQGDAPPRLSVKNYKDGTYGMWAEHEGWGERAWFNGEERVKVRNVTGLRKEAKQPSLGQ